jgi:DNA-binding NarL/FixJ family response regulator
MIKILIADDHDIMRHGLRDLLLKEHPDARITEARDSRETMDWLARETWDLLLLDINMPGRSGLDVLRDARRLHAKTPVLILSAYSEEEFALRAIRLGASAYLNKQRACSELITAIRKVLAGGKYLTASVAEKLAGSLGGSAEDFRREPHESLSTREMEVLGMIAMGRTLKEIAAELNLGEKTISTYRTRIADKMGLSTNVELTRYALQHGLVE